LDATDQPDVRNLRHCIASNDGSELRLQGNRSLGPRNLLLTFVAERIRIRRNAGRTHYFRAN
jgi:hypothetical protein